MRNTRIAYILEALYKSWFWGGIWVLFYLRFTDYAGIGLLESLMIVTRIVTEIPTGAIADLLGKKNTLIVSFAVTVIGNVIMGLATTFPVLLVSVVFMTTSGSLFSGTLEALVYDSLKQEGKEKSYEKVVANIFTIQLIVFAASSVIGGFLYAMSPGLPFLAVAAAQAVGFAFAFFLTEPKVDTEKFSFAAFIRQNQQGFRQLFKTREIKYETLYILAVSIFLVMLYEVLNDVLAVEFGFGAQALGILQAIVYIVGASFSQLTPYMLKRLSIVRSITLTSSIAALTLVLTPFTTFLLGGLTLISRSAPHAMLENISSIVINKNTESKYRATTLSTFNMLKSLPYAIFAIYVGSIMDQVSAKTVAGALGVIVIILIIIFQVFFIGKQNNKR